MTHPIPLRFQNNNVSNIQVELFTLRDKESSFRAKQPDVHFVHVSVTIENQRYIIREDEFKDYDAAKAMYDNLKRFFGPRKTTSDKGTGIDTFN